MTFEESPPTEAELREAELLAPPDPEHLEALGSLPVQHHSSGGTHCD